MNDIIAAFIAKHGKLKAALIIAAVVVVIGLAVHHGAGTGLLND